MGNATLPAARLEAQETTVNIGDAELIVLSAGTGKPLLVLHDELGFPGWTRWTRDLGATRRLVAPLQPGFGRSPRLPWARDYRDVAAFYLRAAREMGLPPVDVIGFSAGGYIAAEMAAACPEAIHRLILVGPLGIRPDQGEIFDFLAVTARAHLEATVSNHEAPELADIYGGEMTPEQFELFEAARAETSRLGWEPFMFSPSLPERLKAVDVPALVVWGAEDGIAPRATATAYADVLRNGRLAVLAGSGHRPEVEAADAFVAAVAGFLGDEGDEDR